MDCVQDLIDASVCDRFILGILLKLKTRTGISASLDDQILLVQTFLHQETDWYHQPTPQ